MSESTPTASGVPREAAEGPQPTIVGIGASAGGLETLKRFFEAVPAHTGLAYVVVVHLPTQRESHLADLLQPYAALPVRQVTGSTALEPDQVYVIPPDWNLSAVDSHLHLNPLEQRRENRAPIDHFFRTLADAYDGHAVAVVLTGTGSDGAQGVRRIREKGGIVIVQDPHEAEFDGMPRSAIETGVVDLVLPVAEIPGRVLAYDRTHPQVQEPVAPNLGEEGDRVPLILTQVQVRTGHDFSRYKRSTIERRIERRMQLLGMERLPAYLDLLRKNPHEAAALADDLLINVTSFFRDRSVYEHLEREVIPRLFEEKGPGRRVRVWSVGCATGEEAYSLGMLLLEEAARRESSPQIQVFASDVDERSLRFARDGLYPETIAADIPPERLARFFQVENGSYRVKKELREMVVFAPHNLLRDPPFSHLDLIACRNLMIYLQRSVQEEVVELFHYALHDPGYLLLGTAETIERSELFRIESKEHHIYRRRNVSRAEVRLPILPLATTLSGPLPALTAVAPRRMDPAGYGDLHQRMVERFAPPSLLVGADHTVLHVSENAGRYLRIEGGLPSNNVFRLVREELRAELRAQLHLAEERRAPSRSRPIAVPIEGETRRVVLRVSPTGTMETEGHALVLFDEVGEDLEPGETLGHGDSALREVEAELETTRSRLHALVEEFETSQEEMRASNEELQSANEELRSTMEELETSREELQSINEELQTVNQENRHKVEELSQLSSDLQNLLKSTDVATLFLDRSLRILRFTPRVGELFNVRNTDRGRPLADLTHRLGYGGLLEDAKRVLETLVSAEREVESEDGRWHLVRVMPYRTVEDRIDGVVITLVDVTRLKRAEEALQELNETLEDRVEERTAELEREVAERRRAEASRAEVLRQLVAAEENERGRISRELHDQLGQQLTGLLLGLTAARGDAGLSELAERLQGLERLATEAARDIQNMAVELRPPALDTLGLVAAVQSHLEAWGEHHGIEYDFHVTGLQGIRLSRETETTLYRVVQEGLTNVLKHAGAGRVSLVLERRDGIARVILEDDGGGFDVEETLVSPDKAKRLGVRGMRERLALLGGELQIDSSPGNGTTLFVRVPAPEGEEVGS